MDVYPFGGVPVCGSVPCTCGRKAFCEKPPKHTDEHECTGCGRGGVAVKSIPGDELDAAPAR